MHSRTDRNSSRYRRHRNISEHAIERLRERVSRDLRFRGNDDLGNLLDSAIEEAIDAGGNVEEFLDDGKPSKLIDISHILDVDVLALVRGDSIDVGREVVVTVLTPEQATNNRADGRWTTTDNKTLGFARLGDKLKLPNLPTVPTKTVDPAPVLLASSPVTERDVDASVGAVAHEYLVSGEGPEHNIYERCAPEEVRSIVLKLIRMGCAEETIEVHRLVAVKVTVSVTVEES